MKTKSQLIIIAIFFIGLTACKRNPPDYSQQLNERIEQGKFNGNVLIFNNGETILKKVYGLSNINTGDSLNINSIFRLGSISKQFTAIAVAILAEDGALSYNQDIRDFIPTLPYEGITIENLLQHTSGLPDYLQLMIEHWKPELKEDDPQRYITGNGDIIRTMVEKKPEIHFEPGERWEYSNTGYVLLATIAERASGMSFQDFMQDRVFGPVGMTDTSVYEYVKGPDTKMPLRVFGYSEVQGQRIANDTHFLNFAKGDGGIYSTLGDLLKWDRVLYTERLVTKATLEKVFTRGRLNNGEPIDYGYGWFVGDEDSDRKIVYHGGGWVGFGAYIYRDFSNDSCFIILTNNSNWKEVEALVDGFKRIMSN